MDHSYLPEKPVVKHRITPREMAHVIAALRVFGRWQETTACDSFGPRHCPTVRDRLKGLDPMTLDEIETLIGRLDGSWTGRGLRTWDAFRYL